MQHSHYTGKRKESFTMAMIMASKEENRTSAPREPKCIEGHRTLYSNQYDAYYCVDCMDWLTEKCIHEGCNHCTNRPKRPEAA